MESKVDALVQIVATRRVTASLYYHLLPAGITGFVVGESAVCRAICGDAKPDNDCRKIRVHFFDINSIITPNVELTEDVMDDRRRINSIPLCSNDFKPLLTLLNNS